MKRNSIFSAVLALCTVVFPVCEGHKNNHTEINAIQYPTFTGCGGVIPLFWNLGAFSAKISYKEGTTIGSNEFCVWTFIAEDTAGDVRIDFYENIPESADGIVVYSWKGSQFASHKISRGNSSLTIDVQHFAVAFSSDFSVESNGFYFLVSVQQAGDGVTIPKAYFSGQNKGKFTYPRIIEEDRYKNGQRVSVVLHGPLEAIRQTREYSLRDLDTEENQDFVDMYVLWPAWPGPHYKYVGRFSGQEFGTVAKSTVITAYPVLYLFSSGSNSTGKGFTVTWKLFGNGVEDTGDFMIHS